MAEQEPVGVTFEAVPGQSSVGVYEVDDGVPVFVTDDPYLLSDGKTRVAPVPVFDAEGPTYTDGMGNVQAAIPVTGLPEPEPGED